MAKASTQLQPLRVLLVCTGNICRSPLAEQLLQQMSDAKGVSIAAFSAGTFAEVGNAMHPKSVQSMVELGFEPREHIAQQLTPELLDRADLVLSATQEHRSRVAQTNAEAIKKSFTITEFARVGQFLNGNPESIDASVLAEAVSPLQKVELASRYRGYAPPALESDDIDDPWGRDYAQYQRVAKEIQESLMQITNWWGPA
ncbi:MAG: hypothetical protein ACKORF_04615 [Micrococcales bacterium]